MHPSHSHANLKLPVVREPLQEARSWARSRVGRTAVPAPAAMNAAPLRRRRNRRSERLTRTRCTRSQNRSPIGSSEGSATTDPGRSTTTALCGGTRHGCHRRGRFCLNRSYARCMQEHAVSDFSGTGTGGHFQESAWDATSAGAERTARVRPGRRHPGGRGHARGLRQREPRTSWRARANGRRRKRAWQRAAPTGRTWPGRWPNGRRRPPEPRERHRRTSDA